MDTSAFEVEAHLDPQGLSEECARRSCEVVDRAGFVVIPGFLSPEECDRGLTIVKEVLADPNRERSAFASETDIRYGRRDFCPLPRTEDVLQLCSLLTRRARRLLTEFCGMTRPVLEISTLTTHRGSSHQYLHRDPSGVLCVFAALDDVSPEQGGTVFAPGTHPFPGSDTDHDGKADRLMNLFQLQCNMQIFRHNLRVLWGLKASGKTAITNRELKERLLSRRSADGHQPNLYQFLTGRRSAFNVSKFRPGTLARLLMDGRAAADTFRLVQVSPRKGALIVYRSDILHAGPDNSTDLPRCFLNLNLARDVVHPTVCKDGYAAHSTLRANPLTLGQLMDHAV